MPDSYDDLVEKAGRVRGLVPLTQVDIMDGIFVPSKSWPYTTGGVRGDEHFVALAHQEEGLAFWDDLDYEGDLMIAEPEKHIDEWLPLGASRLIFHVEAIEDHEVFWSNDIFKEGARDVGGDKVVEVGLAINPDTPLETIELHVGKDDLVQCMGIAKIGYQGEPFDERVFEHINKLRVKYPNLPISVDGGVNKDTAKLLKQAGATRLAVGSVVFGSSNVALAIEELRKAAI